MNAEASEFEIGRWAFGVGRFPLMAAHKTPAELGYRMPAEWEPHAATWLSWPRREGISFPDSFDRVLPALREMVAALVESAGARPAPAGEGLLDGKLGVSLAQLRVRDHDARWIRLVALATQLRGWAFDLSDWIDLHYFAHADAPLRSMLA